MISYCPLGSVVEQELEAELKRQATLSVLSGPGSGSEIDAGLLDSAMFK